MTSNVKQQYAGSDFIGGNATAKGALETLFRPSDIAVGPDGALYVSDWIDHARRRAPGSGRNDFGSDLPHRPEGVHAESAGLRRVDGRRA